MQGIDNKTLSVLVGVIGSSILVGIFRYLAVNFVKGVERKFIELYESRNEHEIAITKIKADHGNRIKTNERDIVELKQRKWDEY